MSGEAPCGSAEYLIFLMWYHYHPQQMPPSQRGDPWTTHTMLTKVIRNSDKECAASSGIVKPGKMLECTTLVMVLQDAL